MPLNDFNRRRSYGSNMPRKLPPKLQDTGPDWYLVEWMRATGTTQAKLGKVTGWSKSTVNDIYHGKTHYYRDIVNECARALNIHPFELLMTPEHANAIRAQQKASFTVVESVRSLDPEEDKRKAG